MPTAGRRVAAEGASYEYPVVFMLVVCLCLCYVFRQVQQQQRLAAARDALGESLVPGTYY